MNFATHPQKVGSDGNRCEGICNQAGKPSVTFCAKEEQYREGL